MKDNWIYCHFRMQIRTNNEVEGAHFSMMCQVRMQHKPFYSLVNNLFREAEYIQYKVLRLWNNEKLSKKKVYNVKRDKFLSTMWEKLDISFVNATEFLDIFAQQIQISEQFVIDQSRKDLDDDE